MVIRVLLVAFCLSMSGAAWSAAYLKIGSIEGESRAEGHEGEIDVLSWSWGADTNRRRGCVRDFHFVKSIDKSSAPILMGQIIQEVYPEALLTVEHTGSAQRDRFEFLTLRFRNVRVESFNTGGSDGSNFSEQVSFNFEEVEYSYTPRKQDGSEGSPVTATISARQCRNN